MCMRPLTWGDFVGWIGSAMMSSQRVMCLPWLWMISGIPSSIALLRDIEFTKLKMWFHMWA